jgi:AAHS family benzoate transporter-like MFS transporter
MTMTADRRGDVLGRTVLALCWTVVLLEGFDLFAYSTVIPVLLQQHSWGLSPAEAGRIGSYATFGMLCGSLVMGTITDRFGRRITVSGCVIWFSVFTMVSAVSPNVAIFGTSRFLAGLALGGIIPAVMPLALEYAPARGKNKGFAATVMMSGYHTGGIVVAALAIGLLPALGWRSMFWAGALPLVVILPLLLRYLPESPAFLLAHGRRDEAEKLARKRGVSLEALAQGDEETSNTPPTEGNRAAGLAVLFHPRYLASTLLFFIASFMGLLLVYGFGTWLPELMRGSGYSIGSSMSFLVITNLGAIVGMLVSGRIADRAGTRSVCIGWFAIGAVFVGIISIPMPTVLTYLAVALAGFFLFTAQVLLYAHVAKHYPFAARATALGWVAGIGRLGSVAGPALGGILLGAHLGVWNFYTFAAAGLIGALAVAIAPRPQAPTETNAPSVAHAEGAG